MLTFKCKMCGGTLEFDDNASVATCEYCGTTQTLPKLDGDKKANLYDRANHFRRNNEYDKAMAIYEQILNEDNTDSESYWSLVLCRYGIEYVEDPATHKRVPTVNRAQFTSIFDDNNYKLAIKHADVYQRKLYEDEANEINEIQKGILAISQKEEPFDVFICYKETDNNGRRTPDSVLANDLYHQLTQEGFKVFFARITLEDKLGSAYEPYIFAALNSAKVMVVLGTKPEYFNAVWVKNEWSRYLALVKNSGGKKMLIPAYRDMDPYDLPEEFSHLQAQDMSKLGFMQDLVRGIKKLTETEKTNVNIVRETVVSESNPTVDPLLKRVFMFLEDGDWISANEYCEKVLDIDPENALAYLGKLMAELHVKNRESLKNQKETFDSSSNYQKIMRFGDAELRRELKQYIEHILKQKELERLNAVYNRAIYLMRKATTESQYKEAAETFKLVSGHLESDELTRKCLIKAEDARKNAIYASCEAMMSDRKVLKYESSNPKIAIIHLETAITQLKPIAGWRDVDEKISAYSAKIEKLQAIVEENRIESERKAEITAKKVKKIKKNLKIVVIIAVIAFIGFVVYKSVILPKQYKEAFIEEYGQETYNKLSSAEVGDYITFGKYEQDNNTKNGTEDIEWLVLDEKFGKTLLISKYALDSQQYNKSYTSVTWEDSSLRKWLNEQFIDDAFSDAEKNIIVKARVAANANPEFSSNPGGTTHDKVFLLSLSEAEKYFDSDDERKCQGTNYAVKRLGTYTYNSNHDNYSWALRTPGRFQDEVSLVHSSGKINESGVLATSESVVVRPAMWVYM